MAKYVEDGYVVTGYIQDGLSIDWGRSIIHVPKVESTLIQTTPVEIRELDLNQFRLNLKELESSVLGMAALRTHNHNTTVSVGGVDLSRVIEIINGYTVTFEDGQYAINLVGANSNVGDVVNVNQVSVRTANSVGLVTSTAIEYGEYDNSVTVKKSSTNSGTIYPIGTKRRPVNNIQDAVTICRREGFTDINIVESIDLVLGDDVSGLNITGVSNIITIMNVHSDAIVETTTFNELTISGSFDGNNQIRNCIIKTLDAFNGSIIGSYLEGVIQLSGLYPTQMENCYTYSMSNPPHIKLTNYAHNLGIAKYSGLLFIEDVFWYNTIGIDMTGQINLSDTCVTGMFWIGGNGEVVNNTGIGCYVVDTMIDGSKVDELQPLIEHLRPHHTGSGDTYYWNPVDGVDFFDGKNPKRAVKTFAHAHNLAKDNNHDIIYCISGDPDGTTITNENIVISKNYLFLRGPGRDFRIHSIDDSKPAIEILGNGVEVSGMIVSTELTNTKSSIESSGGFPLIEHVYLGGSVNGIHFSAGRNSIISGCKINENTGYGLKYSGSATHAIIQNSHIGSNGSDAILIDMDTGHEIEIMYTSIHGNNGYGINAINGTEIIINSDTSIFENVSGDYFGNGIIDLRVDPIELTNLITDSVLSTDLAPYEDNGGLGGAAGHLKHLEYKIFIDTVDGDPDGDGSQHKPFDNENDGIDYAEAHGLRDLILYNEITLYKQIKNFVVRGVGKPKVNLNNQNIKNSEFIHCELSGTYLDRIIAEDCHLTGNGTYLNGGFKNCALSSAFIIPDGGSAFIDNTKPYIIGFNRPSFDIGGLTGTAHLSVMGYEGGMRILNCNQPTDDVKIVLHGGVIEIDSSCTDGSIRLIGEGTLINNSSLILGSQLINNLIEPSTITQIDSNVNIIDGKIDIVDTNIDTSLVNQGNIEDKIDIVDANIDTILINQGNIDIKVDTILTDLTNIEDKIDIVDTNVDLALIDLTSLLVDVNTINTNVLILDGKIDIIDGNVDLVLTDLSNIEDKIDIVDANIDLVLIDLDIIDNKVDDLITNQATPLDIWNVDKDTLFDANSMGEWVVKKLLTIKAYLGFN